MQMKSFIKLWLYAFVLIGITQMLFSSCKNEVAPTVSTIEVAEITQTSATSGGSITDDGGAPVIARGVCWSTNQNPTINDSNTEDGTGVGGFISRISNLEPNTKYFVKAFATNSVGTGYGSAFTFTTLEAIKLPTLLTTVVTEITQTSAISGGNITDDGAAAVTTRGVCWSTNPNPSINDNKTQDGSGVGSFTSSVSDLEPNTIYYLRAYAINSEGTGYGDQVTFSTLESDPPVQILSPADDSFIHGMIPIVFSVNVNEHIIRTEFKVNYEIHEAFVGIPEEIYLNTNQFEQGATLNLQLKIISREGNEFNSNIVSVAISSLLKPIVTAEIISNNSIKLFWHDNSNNKEGYRVKRKEGNNDYITIAELNENINEFQDNEIDTTKFYSYAVEVFSNHDAILSDALHIEFERNKYIPYKEFNVPETVDGKVRMSPDARKIALTNYYNNGSLINTETEVIIPVPHPNGSHGLAMSNDGSFFITGGTGPFNIIVWELSSLNIINQINTESATWSLLTNTEDNQVVAGGEPIRIFNMADGNLIKTFSLHADYFIRDLKYSQDESILISGGNDDIVKTWNVNSGQVANTYSGHSGHVGSVCFSDDESKLWSGSYEDRTIRIWNRSNQSTLRVISFSSAVISLVNGNDGDTFAATSGGRIHRLDQDGNIFNEIHSMDILFDIDYNKTHDILASYGRDQLYKVKLYKRIGHWVVTP